MNYLDLYDSERLIVVYKGEKEVFYVLRCEGICPLTTKHRVKKRDIPIAIALFKDHPDGIQEMKPLDMRYKQGENWKPLQSLDHKAQAK